MNDKQFDDLTRLFAAAPSRKHLLKGLVFGGLAFVFGGARITQTALATSRIPPYCPPCAPCTACNIDTTAGTTTCGSCPSGCPGTTLCAHASNDTSYKSLLAYLDNLGFQPTKQAAPNQRYFDVSAAILSLNGQLQDSVLSVSLADSSQPDQTAELFYTVKPTTTFSAALVSVNGVLSYGLFVDAAGQIQQELPPPPPATPDVVTPSLSLPTPCNIVCNNLCGQLATSAGCGVVAAELCAAAALAPPAFALCLLAVGYACTKLACYPICNQYVCTCALAGSCAFCHKCMWTTCIDQCVLEGQQCCDGTCQDTLFSDSNCGECFKSCGPCQHCENGVCTDQCLSVETCCNGQCINTTCPSGETFLKEPVCACTCGGQTCALCCNGACCSTADVSNSTAVACSGGSCVATACASGYILTTNGTCTPGQPCCGHGYCPPGYGCIPVGDGTGFFACCTGTDPNITCTCWSGAVASSGLCYPSGFGC